MPLLNSPKTGLLVHGLPGEEHYTELMRQWRGYDLLIQCTVLGITPTPPATPADGDAIIVAPGGTGAFLNRDDSLARWNALGILWEFIVPEEGWEAYNQATNKKMQYNGLAWVEAASGTGADVAYTYQQDIAATVWTIGHGLGKYPSVSIMDFNGNEVLASVQHVDVNNVTLTFSVAFAGRAFLN